MRAFTGAFFVLHTIYKSYTNLNLKHNIESNVYR